MSEHKKKIILAITALIIVAGIFIFIEKRQPQKTSQQYTPPPVPTQLLNLDAKERQLKDLLSKNPENRDLLFELATLYFDTKRFSEAIPLYRKILKRNPNDMDTLIDLALALHYTKNSEQAAQTLKKATTIEPDHQRAWLSLGYILASSGKTEDAKAPLKRAIELGPDNPVGKEAARILGIISRRPS